MEKEKGNVISLIDRIDMNADINNMKNFIEETPPKESRYCPHSGVIVSEFERTLTCRVCGAKLDPFDYLLSLAKKETRLDWELRTLRGEIKQHREGLENLKREEVNCRARIRTAQFRLNDINTALNSSGAQLLKEKGH